MKEFAGRRHVITLALETFGHDLRFPARVGFPQRRVEKVDAGGFRIQATHQAGPGRIAYRGLAMSVGEEDASLSEAIDVRRARLRMTTETADPVIEVVNGDEEDVGLSFRRASTKPH